MVFELMYTLNQCRSVRQVNIGISSLFDSIILIVNSWLNGQVIIPYMPQTVYSLKTEH